VLAHTLSALSVQMEALDSLVASGADGTLVRNGLQRSRQLVVSGLEETRQAVRALRDEPVAVADQVATAASDSGANVTVVGTPRPLSAAHGLALVRVAQEALTNVRKHAAGAPTTVTLEFLQSSVRVTVANDISAGEQSTLASTGGGFGLRGMQERIELLGGSLSAGTSDDASTWRVEAVVPT
jgi:signal transduction histidine kinase